MVSNRLRHHGFHFETVASNQHKVQLLLPPTLQVLCYTASILQLANQMPKVSREVLDSIIFLFLASAWISPAFLFCHASSHSQSTTVSLHGLQISCLLNHILPTAHLAAAAEEKRAGEPGTLPVCTGSLQPLRI